MIRQMTHSKQHDTSLPKTEPECRAAAGKEAAVSRRGLWGMFAFLAISFAALAARDYDLITSLPATMQQLLGDAPPPILIHAALAISTVSALILIVGRGMAGSIPGYRWINICLPVLFYPLYLVADTGRSSFIAVLLAGMTLLVLEHLTVREGLTHADKEKENGRKQL